MALHRFSISLHQTAVEQQPAIELVVEDLSAQDQGYRIHFDGHTIAANGELINQTLNSNIDGYRTHSAIAEHDGTYTLYTPQAVFRFSKVAPDLGEADSAASANSLNAPMNGTIVTLLAELGSTVTAGDALLVMEAMKMEHTIRAPADGVVTEFYFQSGDLVDGGAELLAFETGTE